MPWKARAELDTQAGRYIRQRVSELFVARERSKERIQNDVLQRNVFGSGAHLQTLQEEWGQLFRKHADDVLSDLIGLGERQGDLTAEVGEWIQARFDAHVDGLAHGMARTLADVSSGWPVDSASSMAALQRMAGDVKGRGKLRLDTAMGEVILSKRTGAEEGMAMKTDVFIAHASEDKDAVARPLAGDLRLRGFSVWYDEYSLTLGDSLPAEIDRGLASCRFGVVILSPHFFGKNWPRRELDGLATREVLGGQKVILPVWHGVGVADVEKYSPTLAAKLAVETGQGPDRVVEAIVRVLEEGRQKEDDSREDEPIRNVHTGNIDSFWSLLKRGIMGSFHKVSKGYLPLYLAEFSFRYNNRKSPDMFAKVIAAC